MSVVCVSLRGMERTGRRHVRRIVDDNVDLVWQSDLTKDGTGSCRGGGNEGKLSISGVRARADKAVQTRSARPNGEQRYTTQG